MTRDATQPNLAVGVVGAGTMGRGIAQVAATGGCTVKLYDAREGAATEAVEFVSAMLKRAVEKGRMEAADADAATARLKLVDAVSGFDACDVVIEAVIEDIEIKRKVFAEIEAVIAEDAVLATNTSSLSVTRIASACSRPERVAGFHFFNPVPLMPLVEVISGVKTEDWVTDFLVDLGIRMGRQPLRVADAPGFLVNQVGRGYTIEAAHLVSEGVADFVDVDRIMRDAAGFRTGPFELLDLTALDVTHPATVEIYEQYFHEPRFRPSALMNTRMQAGLLGRKVGQGFYVYEDGKQMVPEEAAPPKFDGGRFWVSRALADAHDALAEIVRAAGGEVDTGERPAGDLGHIGDTAGGRRHGRRGRPSTGCDPHRRHRRPVRPGYAPQPDEDALTTPEATRAAHAVLAAAGVPVTVLRDSPGFVAQRIVAMIVNIGASVAQQGIATPEDIDKAVKLGLNYPHGPLGFGDALGADKVLRVLEGLHRQYGDPRYRPNPWIRRRAQLGVSLLTAES